MEICIVESPGCNPPSLLRGRFSREGGTFALLIGPAENVRTKRTRKTLSHPFFTCLGKNLATIGSYTRETTEFRAQIRHWFAAYDAQHLVVFNAEVLSAGTMAAVFEYADTVPAITFVCEPGGYEKTRTAVAAGLIGRNTTGLTDAAFGRDGEAAAMEPTPLAWSDLLARLPTAQPATPEQAPLYTMDHLPIADFLLFRHHARTLNEPELFEAIDADYRSAYKAASKVTPRLSEVITMLTQLTRTAPTTAPIMVALRATQAALFARGWLLSAHQDKALGTLCSVRPPNPTSAHWRALHGYTRTHRVAGIALYLLDIAAPDLSGVTIGEVHQALQQGEIRGTNIPDLARPLLKAHLFYRQEQGGAADEPYLHQRGERRHLDDLIEARRHLGIPIDARFLHGTLPHAARPLGRLGLELRELT